MIRQIVIILMVLFLVFSTSAFAEVIKIEAGTDQIQAALALADTGDVIELITGGGIYHETQRVIVTFPLTIRAAKCLDEKPVVRSEVDHIIDVGSSLWLKGLKMTGLVDDGVWDAKDSTKYAMRSADVVDSGYVLICDNVDFDFFTYMESEGPEGYVYRADESAKFASEIRFTNCTFTRIPSYAFRFRDPTVAPGQFAKLAFENCTFAEIGSYGIRAALQPNDGIAPAQIRVNHCTFNDIGNDVIRMDDGTDIEVTNSIFVETNEVVDAPYALVSHCDTLSTGGFNIDDSQAIIQNIYGEDPEFTDPANFDFTVSDFFVSLALGDDGLVVGDLHWDPIYRQTGVVKVPEGVGKIKAAVDFAQPGDVIELITDGGTYLETERVIITCPTKIRTAEGFVEKPTLTTEADHLIDIGSNLWMEGFKMTGLIDDGVWDYKDSTKYAMRSADEVDSGYVLICDNVDFDFFMFMEADGPEGYVYRADEEAVYASEISFTNCIFTRIPYYGFRFREPTVAPGQFGKLMFENCTFAEIGSYGIRAALNPVEDVTPAQVRVNHCTFYDIGNDALRIDDGTDIIVKNSIFYETNDVVDAPYAEVTYCDTLKTGGFNIDDEAAVIENIFGEDPEFLDPENFDFTVSEFFASLVIGDDGLVVGDPRWAPPSNVNENVDVIPTKFKLSQNYPNPFNPVTTIEYTITKDSPVKLTVFNMLGQKVKTLINQKQKAGNKVVHWNGKDDHGIQVTSGIYIYRLEAGSAIITKKMLLLQ